ncbi:MAG: helix-turn-helix domain-containing protein [Propionibacteriaceae bacterium]|nr:helix-turn-helix domain-containing protein [Propionibacteriaceae bacterium]
MSSATHLVGTRWEPIARRSMERTVGCPLPGWNLCAASSIVMEIDAGQPLPNGNQPMMWVVLNGTITAMVTIKNKAHIAGYMQEGDIFLNTTPREFGELMGLPKNHPILDSPLTLARKRGVAKEDSTVIGAPIRLLSALGKRHSEWYRFGTVSLLRLVAYHMHREYQFLTMSTEERYLAFLQEYPRLAARLSQREVAQYLGLTPVGLNRVVSRLRQRGVLPMPTSNAG